MAAFYQSTIGQKVVMAITGMVLVGFITVHMIGNLLVHRGAAAMNGYAAMLKSNAVLVWGVRIVIATSLLFHIRAAFTLSRRAAAARPNRYAKLSPQVSTWSSRLMRLGGLLLAAFVVFHILHFTTGTLLPSLFVEGEAYQNVVRSFSIGWVAAFYLVAMASLALHLHHGVASMFQTLGASHPNLEVPRRRLALLLAVAIPVGFATIPLGVIFGLVR